jgi:hypothetical protein
MARDDFLDEPTQAELQQMFAQPEISKGEVVPGGRAIGGTEMTLTDNVITARKVEVARDDARILQKLAAVSAYGGEALYYRWPVKNRRTGKIDTVEGPTIKMAYAIARAYGNCKQDIASVDIGRAWIFKATFIDYEAGVASARLFQQDKGVAKIGGEDDARRLDMSFQIGQSKAIRNVIVNYLELPFVAYAMDKAQENLVERVGRNVAHYRVRCAERLADIGVEVLRVERQIGKPLAEWLAPDIARVIAEIKAVTDGMASASESWPLPAPPEPRRDDAQEQGTAGESPSAAGPAGSPTDGSAPPRSSPSAPETPDPPAATAEAPPPLRWRVPADVMGEANIIKALTVLIGKAETEQDLADIEQQNAERYAKFSEIKRANLRRVRDDRLAELQQRTK